MKKNEGVLSEKFSFDRGLAKRAEEETEVNLIFWGFLHISANYVYTKDRWVSQIVTCGKEPTENHAETEVSLVHNTNNA